MEPVQTLCKKDCVLFEKEYCKHELGLLKGKGIMPLIIPKCHLLNENNPQCIPIFGSQSSGKIYYFSIYLVFGDVFLHLFPIYLHYICISIRRFFLQHFHALVPQFH